MLSPSCELLTWAGLEQSLSTPQVVRSPEMAVSLVQDSPGFATGHFIPR